MAQNYIGQITDTSTESGDDLADRLNDFDNAHRTNQSGATRPAGSLAGAIWTRVVAGVYDLMMFNGTKDVAVLTGDGNLAGLTDTAAAQANLHLKALALKDKAAIVGDTTGTLTVARGGTGKTTAADALAALGGVAISKKASQAQAEGGVTGDVWMDDIRVRQAIAKHALGVGQTWQSPGRSSNTVYQNTTGKPIQVSIYGGNMKLEVSINGVTFTQAAATSREWSNVDSIIPAGCYYRCNNVQAWRELR